MRFGYLHRWIGAFDFLFFIRTMDQSMGTMGPFCEANQWICMDATDLPGPYLNVCQPNLIWVHLRFFTADAKEKGKLPPLYHQHWSRSRLYIVRAVMKNLHIGSIPLFGVYSLYNRGNKPHRGPVKLICIFSRKTPASKTPAVPHYFTTKRNEPAKWTLHNELDIACTVMRERKKNIQ